MFSFLWPRPPARRAVLRALSLLGPVAALAAGHAPARALGTTAQASTRIKLPIEVMGADGTTQAVPVYVPSSQPAVTLSLQMHGLTYEDKASVQVNRGPWVSINNNTVQVAEPGKSYGGVGGSFSTLKITLPLAAGLVHAGANVVSFRFNHTDDVSIGFRVLAFNFLTAQKKALLPASAFWQDDPNAWTAPHPDAASIAQGKALWHSASLVKSSDDHTNILATCADCHSEDGRDLKYYSYSNYSIIQRAKFHGLTQLQAEQIASYIRTLPVASYGRPWNPPYQPGAGTDAKPVVQWAAGAGVGAVLDNDSQMMPYLFPNGISKDGIGAGDTLNMRELPVALQLPDWNHWLPRIHPKDAFGDEFTNSWFGAFYDGHGLYQDPHGNIRALLNNPDPAAHQSLTNSPDAQIYHLLGYWSGSLQGDFAYKQQQKMSFKWTADFAAKMESVTKWRLVKDWELMQEYNLEGNAPAIFPTAPGAPTAGENRSWLSESAFLVSPAFVSIPEDGTLYNRLQYEYLANTWYYLQIVLDSGNRHRDGWHPVDWGYAVGRDGDLSSVSGQPSTLRMTAMLIKGMQQSDTNNTVDTRQGWFPHFAGDLRYFYWENAHPQLTAFSPDTATTNKIYGQIITAVAQAQFDKMKTHTPAEYLASTQGGESSVVYGGDSLFNEEKETLVDLNALGIDKTLIRSRADWDKTVWSDFGWDSLKP